MHITFYALDRSVFNYKKLHWKNLNTSHFTWGLVVCRAAHDRGGFALCRWFYELSIAARYRSASSAAIHPVPAAVTA